MIKLSKDTFGNSPAALYLHLLLIEANSTTLIRKVSRVIKECRELLNDISNSHLNSPYMKTKSVAKLLPMVHQQMIESCKTLQNPFIEHVVQNILVGDIRTLKTRVSHALHNQSKIARNTPPGEHVLELKAYPSSCEYDKNERLINKSKKYLQNKGKNNTLY